MPTGIPTHIADPSSEIQKALNPRVPSCGSWHQKLTWNFRQQNLTWPVKSLSLSRWVFLHFIDLKVGYHSGPRWEGGIIEWDSYPITFLKSPKSCLLAKGGLWSCWGGPAVSLGGQEPPVLGPALPLPVGVVSSRCRSFPGSGMGEEAAALLTRRELGEPYTEGSCWGSLGISGTSGALARAGPPSSREVGLDAGGPGPSPGQLCHQTAV